MKRLLPVLRDAGRLARPYFSSEERWSARGLLALVILLNLVLVAFSVWNTYWFNAIYDCYQTKDIHAFWNLFLLGNRSRAYPFGVMPGFTLVATIWILVYVYYSYLNQLLQIRWRRWMTHQMMENWLSDRAYYRISLTAKKDGTGTENPDQRIADDLNFFVSYTMSLGLDLLANVVAIFSYTGVLWSLSGTFLLFGVRVHGYLVWIALINAIIANSLVHVIGRPLIQRNFARQRFEANFRFYLARMRDNLEAIALSRGEAAEQNALTRHFTAIYENFRAIINRTKGVNAFSYFNNLFGSVVPFLVAAPRFFAGAMTLGDLQQIASSFGTLQAAMSWLAGSGTYSDVAYWSATVERLATFQRAIEGAHETPEGFDRELGPAPALEEVTIALPDGEVLVRDVTLAFALGESITISGRSGSGKSTLFRVLAGIWPFGSGTVTAPVGKPLFLPQRPYFPLGTLREAVAYPDDPHRFSDAELKDALIDVGLGALTSALDETALWSQRLSGGEQQRLALARALLARPDWLFMDEATSALDSASAEEVEAVLGEKLAGTTRIAISHHTAAQGRRLRLVEGEVV